MSYAPKGKPAPVVGPGEFRFAAMRLEHGHIYGMCNGLTEAGAQLAAVHDADPAKVACDYPPYTLNKIARAKWVDAGGPAVNLVKNFNWTNDDQNQVAADIAAGKTYDQAAEAWIAKNQAKVDAWLQG